MDGINWNGLVQRQNPFGAFSEGLQNGSQMRMDQERQNLFRQKAAAEAKEAERAAALDQENRLERGIIGNMAGKDPRAAQSKALEVGQFDLAKSLGEMNEQQRKMAREKAEDLGGFAASLKNVPYEQRRGILQQAQETLVGYGFKPEQLANFDPTDQALDAQVAGAMSLTEALQEANRKRDDARAAERDGEMKQYRQDMLDLAGRRVGVSERREGRVAKGGGGRGRSGGGASGVPAGFVLD